MGALLSGILIKTSSFSQEGFVMKKFKIASIPGDGIGKEVVPAAIRVLDAVAELHGGLRFEYEEFPYSCE